MFRERFVVHLSEIQENTVCFVRHEAKPDLRQSSKDANNSSRNRASYAVDCPALCRILKLNKKSSIAREQESSIFGTVRVHLFRRSRGNQCTGQVYQ